MDRYSQDRVRPRTELVHGRGCDVTSSAALFDQGDDVAAGLDWHPGQTVDEYAQDGILPDAKLALRRLVTVIDVQRQDAYRGVLVFGDGRRLRQKVDQRVVVDLHQADKHHGLELGRVGPG